MAFCKPRTSLLFPPCADGQGMGIVDTSGRSCLTPVSRSNQPRAANAETGTCVDERSVQPFRRLKSCGQSRKPIFEARISKVLKSASGIWWCRSIRCGEFLAEFVLRNFDTVKHQGNPKATAQDEKICLIHEKQHPEKTGDRHRHTRRATEKQENHPLGANSEPLSGHHSILHHPRALSPLIGETIIFIGVSAAFDVCERCRRVHLSLLLSTVR